MTESKKFNWSMAAVILSLVVQAAALVFWGAASLLAWRRWRPELRRSLTALWPGWTSGCYPSARP